ncbi:unnamed protein product [Rhizoctonia solani]|uniref:Uncharacterized protein n=1 Tax=Rhizoctonia solani TaxID=456999 RepID=A0A8H3BMK1_9AGAM|nr:unnamed protein product [Rhizoctonia solani]
MSQYSQAQPPYLGGPPGFAHPNPASRQPPNPPHEAYPPNPPLGIPLGPVVSLETVNKALRPLFAIAYETSESVKTAVKGIADLNTRLSTVESGINSLSMDTGHEGDDESPATAKDQTQRPKKRARVSEGASKRTENPTKLKPEGAIVHIMKDIVRDEVLYAGCNVKKMDELKPSLPVEDDLALKKRIQEGSDEAWVPNFMLQPEHELNKFWVDRIVAECLKNATAMKKIEEGNIPKQFWTREYIIDPVLKDLWLTGRKSVKKATGPLAKARAEQQSKAGIRAGRRERLCDSRRRVVEGTEKHSAFIYTTKDGKSRSIPGELIIEDATSDVLSCEDEHNVAGIRPDLSVKKYREARKPFDVEGIPPFWRHAMWTKVNNALNVALKAPGRGRGSGLKSRYYASKCNRGQRMVSDESKAKDIPGGLYRCHIAKTWYDCMTPAQKSGVRPSPPGWEVEDEGGSNGAGDYQGVSSDTE